VRAPLGARYDGGMGTWFSWLTRPRTLATIWTEARLALRLVREPVVPAFTKLLLVVPAAYLLSPLDLLPDLVPGLGQLDDLAVVLLALKAFVTLCPPNGVAFHRRALQNGRPFSPMPPEEVVIDAEWKRS